jgi:thioredoxin 1
VIDLTDKNFDEAVNLSGKCLVYFWAEWCGPCKRYSPILADIQSEYGIQIFKVNADENPVKSSEFSVSSIPTVVLFEGGQPVKTVVGAMPKHLIAKELSQWI